jgi:hypothetical protein
MVCSSFLFIPKTLLTMVTSSGSCAQAGRVKVKSQGVLLLHLPPLACHLRSRIRKMSHPMDLQLQTVGRLGSCPNQAPLVARVHLRPLK